jgi:hypothetical protein
MMTILGSIALGSMSCPLNSSKNLFFGWFQIGIYLVNSQVTRNGKTCIFKFVYFQSCFLQHHRHEHIFNSFNTNLHPISLLIELKFYSMYLN